MSREDDAEALLWRLLQWEETVFGGSEAQVWRDVRVFLGAPDEAELRAERERLLNVLDACGGRNIDVAEQIDEINRALGEDG